ncbi:MAG: hypothetical protein A2758_02320 [Candidatus Zambryskibacteria bacterium RIFCSPHIGHO2_01_FULL_49_18]|uniref:GIY-YIG domain-containing protein n=2 Tax=Candidatus Zambryskiibacteriota TaxID=1817925 RepID=A0A1G2T2P3_9BACT|nr:MAG: hypothetical protein A2758_02320 [Candidatus Zambryskibacteria bacterium RIFCSPHIGHO2_01_FULL_49_18]OHB06159.1 MAG: hypothetical protein A3A26_01280 [Candidatus Zambryskibacteria bacterium RIFCSPLOWO2_01_FULL_47_14]
MAKSNVLSEHSESKENKPSPYSIYILRFSDDSLYIGQTNNLSARLTHHHNKQSKASKFSKEHGEFKLVFEEQYHTRLEAMRREKQLKGWTRAKKEALIKGDIDLLKKL